MAPTSRASRPVALGAALAGAATLGHYLPSVTVLGTFLDRPPVALPRGWCRWRLDDDATGVALTFDDGPSADTPRTLDLLDRLGLRATFFVVGEAADRHPGLVAEMAARGHDVGVHGYRHEHHLRRRGSWVRGDTDRAVTAVGAATGRAPRWYRPPYGQMSARTILEARRHGLQVVLWSRWGKEWAETSVEPVLDRLAGGLRPGAILLLHDSDRYAVDGTAARTHQVLPLLAEELDRRGLETTGLAAAAPTGSAPAPR